MLIDEDGAERMIAVGQGAAGDLERAAQKMRIILARDGIGNFTPERPALCGPISERSTLAARLRISIRWAT